MGPWDRLLPDGSVEVVGPEQCPNGHKLDYPNVLIGATSVEIWYLCKTCNACIHRIHRIHRMHNEEREWVTDGANTTRWPLDEENRQH